MNPKEILLVQKVKGGARSLAKREVVVVVLPNANIPPATAQSGSTVASYHTGAGRQEQAVQAAECPSQAASRGSAGGRALVAGGLSRRAGGLSEERRTRAARSLAPPVVHHAPAAACSILRRADTTFQDLGLTYIFGGGL